MDIFNGLDIFNIMLKVVAPAVTDDAEEDEESMDWWTKYFASIDTMIEVSCGMITKTRFNANLNLFSKIFSSFKHVS